MIIRDKKGFVLPELHLSSLPTGAVKQLVDTLGKRIANSEYEVGNNIPMEPELVAEHGVSRTVVREAIKVLSGKGLVRTARRYGTQVCAIDEWNLLDPDVIGWHNPYSPVARRIFKDATQFRLVIEPQAASLAASKANDLQSETISLAAQSIDGHGADDNRLAADFAFHCTILDASGNLMLRQLRGFLHAILQFTFETKAVELADPGMVREYHVRIAEAINNRDGELAAKYMHEKLSVNNDHAIKLFNQADD